MPSPSMNADRIASKTVDILHKHGILSRMQTSPKFLLILCMALVSNILSPVFARADINAVICDAELNGITHPALIQILTHPELAQILDIDLMREIVENPENTQYTRILTESLEGVATRDQFVERMKSVLVNKVPKASIENRVAYLLSQPTNKRSILRALGDMNLREVQQLLHGGNLAAPTEDSLLGQYLKETGAKTLLRTFGMRPPVTSAGGLQGPQRLIVPISPASFAAYEKYFYNHNFMSVWAHAQVMQAGQIFSYSHAFVPFRLPGTPNTALPQIILSSSEAQRLEQYSQLFKAPHNGGNFLNRANAAMYPWALPGYCATGGYSGNCTQWIGNIPIGDKLVSEYRFPPNFEMRLEDKSPIRAPLAAYEHKNELMKRVWKAPGNEQLADVIGQHDAGVNAEFANPGWLVSTLIGPTTNERVPLLFIVVEDHTADIPIDVVPNFERPF